MAMWNEPFQKQFVVNVANTQTLFNIPKYRPGTGDITVYLNGALLIKDADYTETDATSLTFSYDIIVGDVLIVLYKNLGW